MNNFFTGALAYAELGTMNPSSGAEYVYFMDAFGSFAAYMFSWTSALILKPSQIAIICLSFAEYVVEYFTTGCQISDFSVKMISVITIRKYTQLAATSKRRSSVDDVYLLT